MNKYKKLASNTLILAIGQFSSRFLVFIMMRFYTGLLSTDGYGTVGLIMDTCLILMTVVTLSVNDSLIRFGLDEKYNKTQVFTIGLTTVLVGLVLFAFATPFLGNVNFGESGGEPSPFRGYVTLMYFYVASGCLRSCCALFARSAGYVKLYAIDGLLTTAVNIALNLVFMLALGWGVKGYLLSVILADIVSIAFIFYMAELKRFVKFRSDNESVGERRHVRRSMYRYCIPLIPTSVMWWVISVSAGFFIMAFIGSDANGLFKAAYRLPSIIIIISVIFSQAWNMSAITENNSRSIAQFYTDVFNVFQSVIYIMAAGLLLIIRPALSIMTPAEFDTAYRFSALLTLAVVFTCFSTFLGSVYVASKKSVRSMLTALLGAITNILLNFALIPTWGLQGAAVSALVSYVIIFTVRIVDTQKIIPMDLKLPKMLANLTLISLMSAVVVLVETETWYYTSLSMLFLATAVLNFRSAIAAIQKLREKPIA